MKQYQTLNGIVEAISNKPESKTYSIKVGDKWLGGFKKEYQTENDSLGYQQVKDGSIKRGSLVYIKYSQSVYNDKIMYNIAELIGQEGDYGKSGEVKETTEYKPRNYEREALEKCTTLWAGKYLTTKPIDEVIKMVESDKFHELFKAIKSSGERFEATMVTHTQNNAANATQTGSMADLNDDVPLSAYENEQHYNSIPF